MGKVKESIQQVYDECQALYEKGGAGAVIDHVIVQQDNNNPMYDEVKYKYCTGCASGQPNLHDTCLVCGADTSTSIFNDSEVEVVFEIQDDFINDEELMSNE